MSKAYIELGSVPAEEDCVQVGINPYIKDMQAECLRYKALLEKTFTNLLDGMLFSIKQFQHEFGIYMEVVVYYDHTNKDQVDLAYKIGDNLPTKWDGV